MAGKKKTPNDGVLMVAPPGSTFVATGDFSSPIGEDGKVTVPAESVAMLIKMHGFRHADLAKLGLAES